VAVPIAAEKRSRQHRADDSGYGPGSSHPDPGRSRGLVRACSLLVAAWLTVGCGAGDVGRDQSAQPSRFRIGVSFDLLNEIRRAELEAIQSEARRQNAAVTVVVANNSADQQRAQIDDLISGRRVDAIIAIAQDREKIISSITRANRAAIPFIAIDRAPAPGGSVTFQITGDPVADGMLAGRYMVSLNRPLTVLHLWGALTDDNAIGRRDGFNQAVTNTQVRVVSEASTNWDPKAAGAAVTQAIQTHPELNAIFAPSDFLLPEVAAAVEKAGRSKLADQEGHIVIVTIDGDPVGCHALEQGLIDADVATLVVEFGKQAVTAAVHVLRHEQVGPAMVKVPGLLLNRSNLITERTKAWGCQQS
jgi:ABC-type sugar transport system substrate-binding protein